jgi:SAM-dependent methyltransferase
MSTQHWQLDFRNGLRYLKLPDGTTFPTRHSSECLSAIYDVKGREGFEWFVDEVRRAEIPNDLSMHLKTMIERLHLTDRRTVLDFGAGSGASTVALADLGFKNIDTVEIDGRLVEIARLRTRDFGCEDKIRFHLIKPGESLPFEAETYDLILCYAVIEHIHPKQRGVIMRDLWRILKPGGVILVLETPNIIFPYGNHFPFLYFTPWMPLPMVKIYGRMRGRIEGEISDESLYLAGLRGTTPWHVLRYTGGRGRLLPSLESNPEEEYLRISRERPSGPLKMALKQAIIRTYQKCLKPLGVPFCSIFPQLNFGIEKIF